MAKFREYVLANGDRWLGFPFNGKVFLIRLIAHKGERGFH